MAERLLQRAQPPPQRRLGLADLPRRRAQRAVPGDRQEQAQVTPFHATRPKHKCLKIVHSL